MPPHREASHEIRRPDPPSRTKWCEHQTVLRSEIHHATKHLQVSRFDDGSTFAQLHCWGYKYEESAHLNPAIQDEFRCSKETYIASLVAGARGLVKGEYMFILPGQTFHSALHDPWRTILPNQYTLFWLCGEHKSRD
jgi:hypothetical protein